MVTRIIVTDGSPDDGKTCGYFRFRKEADEFMIRAQINPATVKVVEYGDDADPAKVIPDVQAAWEYLFFTGNATGIDGSEPRHDDAYARLRVCGKAWNLYRGFDPTDILCAFSEDGETWRPSFKIRGATVQLYCDGAAPSYGFAPYGPWLVFDSVETATKFGEHFIGLFSQWMRLGRARKS